MSAKKTERLLNLVICLLATRRYLSVQDIRAAVPGYEQGTEEAFRRMFERDKEELRELGIPLETGTSAAAHDDEVGYRIARRTYELPEISLEPDEAAALGLAARLWQSGSLAGATGSALLKLRAAGALGSGADEPEPAGALEPRVEAAEPAFEACLSAVRDRQPVRFRYRASGRTAAEERRVQPWGVVSWHGRWYLVGHDTGRGDRRVFRLSRMLGEVRPDGEPGTVTAPDGVDLRGLVAEVAAEQPRATARVRVRAGAGWPLRREATASEAGASEATASEAGAGWDVLELGYSDPERLADRVAGYGSDAVVLSPPECREAVVRRLRELAGDAPVAGA